MSTKGTDIRRTPTDARFLEGGVLGLAMGFPKELGGAGDGP